MRSSGDRRAPCRPWRVSPSVMAGGPMDGWADLPGRLFVVSGPSGSGKSTLVRRVLDAAGGARLGSRSRRRRGAPRPGERDGRRLLLPLAGGVRGGPRPGRVPGDGPRCTATSTARPPARSGRTWRRGVCVMLEIDVQGALQVRERVPEPRSWSSSTPRASTSWRPGSAPGPPTTRPTIARRLANARRELEQADSLRHAVHQRRPGPGRRRPRRRSLIRHGCGG